MYSLAYGIFRLGVAAMGKRKNTVFYYAVRKGRKPGVYFTWPECEAQVKGFNYPKFRKFGTEKEAWDFVNNVNSEKTESEPQNLELAAKRIKTDKEGNDRKETVHVYTDGACPANGRNVAQAGIGVYWGPNNERNISERLPGRQTNNRAEIHAAVRALEQAKEIGTKHVTLYTDSKFVINGITNWIDKWKKNGWKLATNKPVINKEDFQALDEARSGLSVDWVHVRGHQGLPGNEAADKLAVEGSQKPLPE